MKTDRKPKAEKKPPAPKTNGIHPLAVYEHIPIGIVETSLEGSYMEVNEEFCRILGYPRDELLGMGIKDCTHEDDYSIDSKLHEQLVTGQIPFYRLEKRFIRKSGGIIWVELTRTLVCDNQGNPLYTMGVVLDISDRKDVEKVLRESVERLRLATETARMFMWEWDFQNYSYILADNFEQVLGFSANLLPKNRFETISNLIPAEDVQSISQAFEKAVEAQRDLHSLPCRVINPETGQLVWLEISAKIVYDLQGIPERMFGVAQNITESKQVQDEIAVISRMPEENPNPVMRLTPDGEVIYANGPSREMLESWKVNGKNKIPAELLQRIQEALSSGIKKEIEITQNGRTFSCTLAPVLEAGYINFYGSDITGRKQVEEALTESARQQVALYNLSEQFHRADSLTDVFDAALDAILSALQCDRASILLYDNQDVMRFVAWRGLSEEYRKATDGHSPWTPDAKDPQPISVDDIRTADLEESLRAVIQREGIGALAFVPLVVNDRLIGKFMIYYDAPHTFEEAELNLSLTIAHQLAFGVDRNRTEHALKRERETLERLFDTMPVMVSMIDPETRAMRMNAEFERLLGWTSDEVSVSALLEALYPDAAYRNEILQRMAAAAGKNEWVEVQLHARDGRTLDSMWSNISIFEDKKIVTGIALGIDITERKRIEAALRLENERFMRFVDSNIVGIVIGDAEGRILLANDYYLYLLGVSRQDLKEERVDWKKFTPPEWRHVDEKAIRELDENGVCEPYEKEYVRNDGTRVPVYIANAILPGPGKEIAAFVLDMTERRHAEEALRASEERYRGIINQTIGGIAETDLTGKFTMVNERFCEITGYPREKLLREMHIQDITHPEDRPKNLELFGRLITDGDSFEIEKRYVRPDGSDVWVHNSVSAIKGADGKPRSAVAAVIDVTERKRAEETLRRNEQMFSTLINAAPFGVYFIDSEFRLRAINKGSEAVFKGIDPLIGRDFAEILRMVWQEPFATEAIEHFRHTLRTGESFISPPTVEERANVEEIQAYDWQIHRIILPDGTYGVVCYFYDLSDQKRMEAVVRASESLYRAIARSIPGGGVYVVDKDFRYLVAEGPVTDAFGLSRDLLEGRTVSEVFQDERGKRMEERLRRTFEGETVSFETQYNGRFYWTQQAPLYDSIGQAIILTVDITERKRAEEALGESEERFRAILRQATAGIVRKDAEGRLIFVNQAFCNLLEYTEADILGKTMWDLMHEDDIEENKRSYARLMLEGIPFKLERRLLRADGSVIWVDASVSPIMDATGRPQAAVTVEVDITARKQAEEALQQLNLQLEERVLSRTAKLRSVNQALREEITERQKVEEALRESEAIARANEEKLSTLFKLLPVGISFLDLQGQIIEMNPALAHILKLSPEQLTTENYKTRKYIRRNGSVMPPAEFASQRALREGKTVYNVETGVALEDQVIWTSVSAAPVDVADIGAVVVTADITESKRAEQALQESRERLQILSQRLVEVQEEERRAIARELHDRVGQTLAALNINLIIISGQLGGKVDEQISTRLNDSMKLVAETIALVRDVMSNLRPAVLDDYGLESAIESHVSQYTARYEIQVKFNKPQRSIPRLGPSVEMTFLRIAQEALMNIARHAQATQVDLALWQENNAVCMTIQDNGTGITSWQEANRPGSHGLTIMRERAEAFGGNLRVSSTPGKGTKLEVRIPVENSNPPESQKEMHQ